jgi:alpha-tubulin suppressor-like RCC1 family protein
VRSDRRIARSPRLLALAVAALACSSREVGTSCSPTPSCSVDPERFEPPEPIDAGVDRCGPDRRDRPRCSAERLALGRAHSCALSPAGEILCWGDDARGQLGGSSRTDEDAGRADELRFVLSDALAVTAGGAHGCAIDAAHAVFCWGDNAYGQVDGAASSALDRPVRVRVGEEALRADAIAAGAAHTCALVHGEGVRCWGSASHGQSGREVAERALEPGLLPGTSDAVEIAAGARHSCARSADGGVRCWGELFDGEAGELRAIADPRPVPGLDDASEIAAGAGFTCALRQSGAVVCWGANASGQLGDGSTEPSDAPVEVRGLELSLHVAAGGAERDGELVGHACALTKSFLVQCWGRNREGQAGSTSADDLLQPVVVANERDDEDPYLDGITAVVAGGFHTCAIEDDGEVLCWGDDTFDQLGARDPVSFGRPVEVRVFRGDFGGEF